jgi:hypothetical protein
MNRNLNKKSGRWIKVTLYFFVILAFGISFAFAAYIFFPNAKLDAPSPNTTGLRAYASIGAIMAMLVCPILDGFRHWGILNYLIASIGALGLLFGNIGFGIPLSLFSLIILYAIQRLVLFLTYIGFGSQETESEEEE